VLSSGVAAGEEDVADAVGVGDGVEGSGEPEQPATAIAASGIRQRSWRRMPEAYVRGGRHGPTMVR